MPLAFAARFKGYCRAPTLPEHDAVAEALGAVQKERDALANDLQQGKRNRTAGAKLAEVGRESMTNTTLRERFGIDAKNSVTASRLIKEALAAGVIRLQDLAAPPKTRRYLPHWA
jgi:ATP-dependent DNA helicase RecG